ncbi:group II intron reverse transcriptase/maturase [Moorena sp. SIO3I6]|uniref:group II intron reverse transcriptase/maturase n=1 Tax=Moorena sp. SIO3I6 TaxID=2607831 RepID=UPI0013FCDB6C|nr:group II intron reverse transcriptase/maturase [Moorena sp. SIO3I6]NEP26982.1 group II intron reverse transcriptase/maturase [Moorena sp. SIO3I6]
MEKIELTSSDGSIVTEQPNDWHSINWKEAHRQVRKLRQRIFKATREGNWKKVNKLQRLMLRSYSNIQVSVKRVTQENKGRKTAGVDKEKCLNPQQRGQMVQTLSTLKSWSPKPTKRIYIPKSNGKQRPLGIPSITDRCLQAIVKNALEPTWEAQFEGTSYGFRPKRSTHDARQRIFLNINGEKNRKWWVVEADIKGCFDNIAHQPLLDSIGNFPARGAIEKWLKAGYVDKNTFHPTDSGTPQGGIISPLLANIALHGLEEELGITYKERKDSRNGKPSWYNTSNRTLVRFADDFVILTETKEDAANAKEITRKWLTKKGLTLSEEKTRITHLTEGFDFLGWNFRKYKTTTKRTGFITFIKPSDKSFRDIKKKIKIEMAKLKGASPESIIPKLQPIIRGWTNYHSGVVAKETFSKLQQYVNWKLVRWGKRKYGQKSWEWIKKKHYGKFCPGREDQYVFGSKDLYLEKAQWTKITRHTLVTHNFSPDNPDLKEYWEKREKSQAKKTAEGRLPKGKNKIALRQQYVCPYCGQPLGNYNQVHLHHIIPRSEGGEDKYNNLVYVHEDCHKTIHALGASNPQIQDKLFRGIKSSPKTRNKSQKVQNRKFKGEKLDKR